jgi:hypothetical protein
VSCEINIGIAGFPSATILTIIFDLQQSSSCRRPFARHIPSTSSKFQSGYLFGVGVILCPEAVVLASMASERTAAETIVPILFTSITLLPRSEQQRRTRRPRGDLSHLFQDFLTLPPGWFGRGRISRAFYSAFRPMFYLDRRFQQRIPSETPRVGRS